jgi:hypothetical protein
MPHPAMRPSSDLCPTLQCNEHSLEPCPMGIVVLQRPLELSDQALKTSMSICFGVPVPHARFLQATVPDCAHIDVAHTMPTLISFSTSPHVHPGTHPMNDWLTVQLGWPPRLGCPPLLDPALFRAQMTIPLTAATCYQRGWPQCSRPCLLPICISY